MRFSFHTSRRQLLRTSLTGGAFLSLSALGGCNDQKKSTLAFSELPKSLDHQHHVAEGYQAQPLIRWGDPITNSTTPFQPEQLTVSEQENRFGYNNDFVAFMPLAEGEQSGSAHYQSGVSTRGLLCVNHEYTLPHLMFPGYDDAEQAYLHAKPEHMPIEMAACGHSVVEVALQGQQWQVVTDSPYNRRISLSTPIELTGPAAGHARLQTQADPSGRHVLGTLGNCAGGKTPWGTVLIAEEGFAPFFMGDRSTLSPAEQDNYQRLAVADTYARPWGTVDARFDINQEPNEANRFGWMVELNPYDPTATPRKLTALGRFEHEGTTLVTKPNQPVVAYTGDDDEFQFIYKFVSDAPYLPGDDAHNRRLLESGTLFAAKLHQDGSGEWLALRQGEGPLTEDVGFATQADVLIECRRAAQLMGATPMDRPEDIETNPVNDCTYVMLTKNTKRESTDPGNQRRRNAAGHILELVPPGAEGQRDHTALTFQWGTLVLGGDPNSVEDETRGFYGQGPKQEAVTENGWFANPDNLAFDPKGNLWVATDGCEGFGFHDGLWAMATSGPYRAVPKHFFGCPQGAELCGPEFTPDGTTLFVAVQHPGDSQGSSYANPVHRWPDFNDALPPRPSVVAIRKTDGGLIGS